MGVLTLIPTPLDSDSRLHPDAKDLLQKACENYQKNLFLVEEPKASRRRWLRWGLPREAIEYFVFYNEHTQEEINREVISKLKKGFNAYLISDGGLPAYCDPGRKLIDLCHQAKVKVTATTYCNSTSLALALSGFDVQEYCFWGFPPREGNLRSKFFKKLAQEKGCAALMDTAYRLKKVLNEVKEADDSGTCYFLAMDLGRGSEELLKGSIEEIIKVLSSGKRDFVLIKGPYCGNRSKKK